MIGKIITGYKIKKLLGEGGMADVYLAKHTTLGKETAIKVIKPSQNQNDEMIARFEREAWLHSKVGRHENIIELSNYLEENSKHFLIMEYFKSVELKDKIGKQTGPIPFKRAMPIFKQILNGFGHAHSKGFIHRDIKPANILINSDDKIKILDFGIAKQISKKMKPEKELFKTEAKEVQIGTAHYMSPEQITVRDLSIATDIYSIGITFYEILSGRLPFDGTANEVKKNHIYDAPPDPRDFYPDIPTHVVNAILKSLSKDFSERQQSCKVFLKELTGELKTNPVRKEKAYESRKIKSKNIEKQIKSDFNHSYWVVPTIAFLSFITIYDRSITDWFNPNYNESSKPGKSKQSMSLSECFAKGNRFFKNGSYDLARNELENCLIINPNHDDSKFLLAQVFLKQKNWNSSLKLSDELVTSRGTLKDRSIRAESYFELKQYKNAILDYSHLIILDGKNTNYLDYRGWAYYNTSQYLNAEKDFSSLISLHDKKSDDRAEAFHMRGYCHYENNKLKKARSDFSNAIRIDKKNGQYYYSRGLIYKEEKNKKKFCKDFKSAISLGYSGAKALYENNCR